MTRNKFESTGSAVGNGNINVTGYTEYDRNPAVERVEVPEGLTDENTDDEPAPERAWYQIAKHSPTPDPIMPKKADMMIQMYDSPRTNRSEIRLRGNQVDFDSSQMLEALLNFKSGDIYLKAENSTGEFGLRMNSKNGRFKIMDQKGYGIESDGSGNFTWHYESIEHSKGTTMDF
jgi:hypothetical protein